MREFLDEDNISCKPWSSTTKKKKKNSFLKAFPTFGFHLSKPLKAFPAFVFHLPDHYSISCQPGSKVGLIHSQISRLNPQLLYQRSKTLICIFRPPTHGFLLSNCFQGWCLLCSTPKSPGFVQNTHAIGANIRGFSQAFSRNPRAENLFLPLPSCLLLAVKINTPL